MIDHKLPALPSLATMRQMLDRLAEMKLHGILILGHECPHCGSVHNFAVASDFTENRDVPKLMRDMADMCERTKPDEFREPLQ